jgi:hypothetical protein
MKTNTDKGVSFDLQDAIHSWESEKQSAYLCRVMHVEPGTAKCDLFAKVSELNPDELGSTWSAALFSLPAFGAGAIVPKRREPQVNRRIGNGQECRSLRCFDATRGEQACALRLPAHLHGSPV